MSWKLVDLWFYHNMSRRYINNVNSKEVKYVFLFDILYNSVIEIYKRWWLKKSLHNPNVDSSFTIPFSTDNVWILSVNILESDLNHKFWMWYPMNNL